MNAFIEKIERRLRDIREKKKVAHSELLKRIFQDETDILELLINEYIWKQESHHDG